MSVQWDRDDSSGAEQTRFYTEKLPLRCNTCNIEYPAWMLECPACGKNETISALRREHVAKDHYIASLKRKEAREKISLSFIFAILFAILIGYGLFAVWMCYELGQLKAAFYAPPVFHTLTPEGPKAQEVFPTAPKYSWYNSIGRGD
jgi:hypothetical protein